MSLLMKVKHIIDERNTDESKTILFKTAMKPEVQYFMKEKPPENKSFINYLGITIDEKWSFIEYTACVEKKLVQTMKNDN